MLTIINGRLDPTCSVVGKLFGQEQAVKTARYMGYAWQR
jgi:hypothetical protein